MDEAGTNKPTAMVTVTLLTSATPSPGDIARVKAVVSSAYVPGSFHWAVTAPGNKTIKHTVDDKVGQLISFPIKAEGTHRVTCTVKFPGSGSSLSSSAALQAADPAAIRHNYTVRVLPPVSAGLPPSEHTLKVGSVNQEALTWAVDAGQEVTLKLSDGAGKAVAANLRLTSPGGGDPLPRDFHLPSGQGKVRVSGLFHALFIPASGLDLAPLLKPYVKAASLPMSWPVTIDPGLLVSGTVRGAAGSPLAGARVSITTRDPAGVDVPSTVSVADQAGGFKVRARAGKATMTVVPPAASGLSPALVKGASLQVLASSFGWAFSYAKADAVQVKAAARTADGAAPAPGATATFTLVKGSTSVGQLVLAAGGTFSAEPLVRRTFVADSKGELALPGGASGPVSLPRGKYQVALWPAAGAKAGQGYSVASVDLTGASAQATVTLKLGQRVKISGTVSGQGGKAVRAQVTARGTGGTFQAVTAVDGKFSLELDDGVQYRLLARALSSDTASGTLVQPAVKVSGARDLGSLVLPRAVMIRGKVQTSGGLSLAGALIRSWCSDPACSSQSLVDETRSLSDGTFELRLPGVK